jgi:hypothetical protein
VIVILHTKKDVVQENKWQKNQHLDWHPAVLIMTKKLHQFFNFTREMSDVFVTILVMLVLVLCEPTQWLPSEFNCGAFSAILGTLQTNTDGSYSLAFCER